MKTSNKTNFALLSRATKTIIIVCYTTAILLYNCCVPAFAMSLVALSSVTNGLYVAVFSDSPSLTITTNDVVFSDRELMILVVSMGHTNVNVFAPTPVVRMCFAQLRDSSNKDVASTNDGWAKDFELTKKPSDVKCVRLETAKDIPVFQGRLRATPLLLGRPDALFRITRTGEYLMKIQLQVFVRGEGGNVSLLRFPPVQFKVIHDL